ALSREATTVEGMLNDLKTQTSVSSDSRQLLCYAEKTLKAAGSANKAAAKAYDAGIQYRDYAYHYAGSAMMSKVNEINNLVSKALPETEPDLHTLAASLSSVIPDSAQ